MISMGGKYKRKTYDAVKALALCITIMLKIDHKIHKYDSTALAI